MIELISAVLYAISFALLAAIAVIQTYLLIDVVGDTK